MGFLSRKPTSNDPWTNGSDDKLKRRLASRRVRTLVEAARKLKKAEALLLRFAYFDFPTMSWKPLPNAEPVGADESMTLDNRSPEGKLRVNEIFAFLTTDEDGDEGVAARILAGVGALPFIAADRERIDSLRPMVADMIQALGPKVGKVTLCRFWNRQDLEEISGE